MKEQLEKDQWGRIDGMVYKTGKKPGWYFRGEFVASQLCEAYRIIRVKLKAENK